MSELRSFAMMQMSQCNYAPAASVIVRDEMWLSTNVASSVDGFRLSVRGLSEYVREKDATFYTALDHIDVVDPTKVEIVPDSSPGYRQTGLWLETTFRQTTTSLYQVELSVSLSMLLDPLNYQLSAVRKALSTDSPRPRVLIADAVGLGKTLKIGITLAELIRRVWGGRILIIAIRYVFGQFQKKLWSCFTMPLVQLNSLGIQKVRKSLSATCIPFTYYLCVIVAFDAIKWSKSRAQVEKFRWNVDFIDEIHDSTNAGTRNNVFVLRVTSIAEVLVLPWLRGVTMIRNQQGQRKQARLLSTSMS